MKYELTTPLLFANIIRWMAPDIFRTWELTAGTVGTVDVELESEADPAGNSRSDRGRQRRCRSPWTETVALLRRRSRNRARAHRRPRAGLFPDSSAAWRRGLDARQRAARHYLPALHAEPGSQDIWQWLAVLAASGLVADWILYGRMRKGWVSRAASYGYATALEESVMTFDHAWVLLSAVLPIGWLLFEWRRTRRRWRCC